MPKVNKPLDPVRPKQRRCLCVWILHPNSDRCPRKMRTGEPCWCRPNHWADRDWRWRVVPPLAGPDRPGWCYDDGIPLLAEDEEAT
jgi:hypothetical protein